MMQRRNWWKEIIMYQIYPRSFKDSNGDGIGDLRGILEKLDYLKELGIDLLWLGPCFESPNDDNGYDISNYRSIMEEFGTMDDFDELLQGLKDRGIKLILDLVVNHSSDEHSWFEQSRKSKTSPFRDYYIWRKGIGSGPPNNWPSFFGGSAWGYDEGTDEYYLHLFSKKQPDLNWENEVVREEVYDLMKFWLDKGVDGFRMDVIPLISKPLDFPDTPHEHFQDTVRDYYANGPRVHEFLQEMNERVIQHYDIMTVGEGPGITAEGANLYVGQDRKELNMIFALDHMFMDHGPKGRMDRIETDLSDLKRIINRWDEGIGNEGWVNVFFDNHDFPRMLSRFGDDGRYRVESAKLLAIMLMTLRGTPCIYQGTEIGMTNVLFDSVDDMRDVEAKNFWEIYRDEGMTESQYLEILYHQGRDNVRTPVQWSDEENAGFSTGVPWIKVNPNFSEINVEKDKASDNSIFNFYKDLIRFRKNNQIFVYGSYRDLDEQNESLFCYLREDEEQKILITLNFSDKPQTFTLPDDITLGGCLYSNYKTNHFDNQSVKLDAWQADIYLCIK